jgi:transposase
MEEAGHVGRRKRLTRAALRPFMTPLPPVIIGLAACGGAQDWARRFRAHGPTAQRSAPPCVPPSVQSNQNAPGDAEALCAAVTRPTRRFGPLQEVAQPERQSLPRARERGVQARTAGVHAIHG